MVMKTKVRYAILRAAFSFSGRIGRTAYGLSLIICTLLSILILTSILQTKGNTAFLVLLYIPIGWFALAQGAKRCHDLETVAGFSGFLFTILSYYLVREIKKPTIMANLPSISTQKRTPSLRIHLPRILIVLLQIKKQRLLMANIIRIIEKTIVRNTNTSPFYSLLSRPSKFPASCKASKTSFFYSKIL